MHACGCHRAVTGQLDLPSFQLGGIAQVHARWCASSASPQRPARPAAGRAATCRAQQAACLQLLQQLLPVDHPRRVPALHLCQQRLQRLQAGQQAAGSGRDGEVGHSLAAAACQRPRQAQVGAAKEPGLPHLRLLRLQAALGIGQCVGARREKPLHCRDSSAKGGGSQRQAAVRGRRSGGRRRAAPPVLGRRPAIAAAPSRPSSRGIPPFLLSPRGNGFAEGQGTYYVCDHIQRQDSPSLTEAPCEESFVLQFLGLCHNPRWRQTKPYFILF